MTRELDRRLTGRFDGTTLARPRALETVRSVATAWPPVTPAARLTSSRYSDSVRPASLNSIIHDDVVVPAPAGRGGFGTAKQAAPPRGVPR